MAEFEKSHTELDWDLVDFDSDWTWGMGGHPLQHDEWAISYIDDALIETRYKMPSCINRMLKLRYKHGVDDKLRKIQIELEIH